MTHGHGDRWGTTVGGGRGRAGEGHGGKLGTIVTEQQSK